MFATLHDASTADLSQVLADVKKYASEVVVQEPRVVLALSFQKWGRGQGVFWKLGWLPSGSGTREGGRGSPSCAFDGYWWLC